MTNREQSEQPNEVQLDVFMWGRMITPVAIETVVSPTQFNGRASGDCRSIIEMMH